jgi:hypothetical protein
MTLPSVQSEARIATENASKYLQQLSKHFQHKLPASFDAVAGQISFPSGEVRLAAEAATLDIMLTCPNADDLERLKDVVARHLVRFAFREELNVAWT